MRLEKKFSIKVISAAVRQLLRQNKVRLTSRSAPLVATTDAPPSAVLIAASALSLKVAKLCFEADCLFHHFSCLVIWGHSPTRSYVS
eukprot:c13627_g1_i1 orf=63-323(+)